MHQYSEGQLQAAITTFKRDDHVSISRYARDFGMPTSLLHNRLSGRTLRQLTNMSHDNEEQILTFWIICASRYGLPISLPIVLELAKEIRSERPSNSTTIGLPPILRWWIDRFRRHCSELFTCLTRPLDVSRA